MSCSHGLGARTPCMHVGKLHIRHACMSYLNGSPSSVWIESTGQLGDTAYNTAKKKHIINQSMYNYVSCTIHNQLMRHIIKKGLWINNWLYCHCGACMHLVHGSGSLIHWNYSAFPKINIITIKLPLISVTYTTVGEFWYSVDNGELGKGKCVVLYRKRKWDVSANNTMTLPTSL